MRDETQGHPFTTQNIDKKTFVPKILLSNTMSLTPKIGEVSCFMKIHIPNVAYFTETLLQGSFHLQKLGCHGGVGL